MPLFDYLYKKEEKLYNWILNRRTNHSQINTFFKLTTEKSKQIYRQCSHKHKVKFNRLYTISNNNDNEYNTNTEWIKNLTNIDIPNNVKEIVSLGQNHSVPTHMNTDTAVNIIKNVEFTLSKHEIDNTFKNRIRKEVVHNINKELKTKKRESKDTVIFKKKVRETEKFLKDHETIFFTKADKGNTTVCMYKDEYNSKMIELLNDNNTYRKIKRNSLTQLQKNTQELLKYLNNNEFLDKKYNNIQLSQTNTTLAKAYGLPKIHKDNIPIRPIISAVNSPTYF